MAQERVTASETLLEERSRRMAHLDGSVLEGRRRISELEATVSSLTVELAKLKDELEEKASYQGRHSQDESLNALQLEIQSLRAKNEQNQRTEETLLERYQTGKLVHSPCFIRRTSLTTTECQRETVGHVGHFQDRSDIGARYSDQGT